MAGGGISPYSVSWGYSRMIFAVPVTTTSRQKHRWGRSLSGEKIHWGAENGVLLERRGNSDFWGYEPRRVNTEGGGSTLETRLRQKPGARENQLNEVAGTITD